MMWQSLYPILDAVLDRGALPLHAALVAHEGRGVLLAGSGGSGKSTCCQRLPAPWRVFCDDATLVMRNGSRQYTAHPLPTWNDFLLRELDHTWNVHSNVPLRAIVYVVQSEKDRIVPMGSGEAATRICQSAAQASFRHLENLSSPLVRTWRQRTFENACNIASVTPTFMLRVSRFGQFWRQIEEILGSQAT